MAAERNVALMKVLVVDDNKPMRDLAKSIIGTMGVKELYVAEDGGSAFEVFLRHRPDLVLTDWHMQPVTGLELVHMIRDKKKSPAPDTPVILMTGKADNLQTEKIIEARNAGVTQFITKPFNIRELQSRIERAIKGSD